MPNITRARGPDGWLSAAADWGLVIGSALYWNTAKTWFRVRGARGQAPCQHPSDSGREGESFCEACIGFNDPRRFARVCPLVRFDSPRGPRCAVGASQVRPFWGRVFLALGLAAVVGGVGAGGGILLALRAVGYQVTPGDLLWPARWPRVRVARADYYEQRGLAAYARGDAYTCYLALLQARSLGRADFATNRLLAQVAQTLDPSLADQLFGELVRSPDPLRAANAAEAWAPALLARGSFNQLAGLSAYMLHRDGPDAAAWTNALVFTCAHGADEAMVRQLLAEPGPPAADSRAILEWSLRPGSAPLNTELLAAGRSSSSLAVRHYALHRLIRAGQAPAVLQILSIAQSASGTTRSTSELPPREIEELRLAAWGELRQPEIRRREIQRIVGAQDVSPALAEMLAAHLISYPDRPAAAALFAAVERHPFASAAASYSAYAALVCLAGIDRDIVPLKALTARLGQIAGRPFGRANQVGEIFFDRTRGRSLAPALVALQPLSLEVMFAVLGGDPHPAAAPAEKPKAQAAR